MPQDRKGPPLKPEKVPCLGDPCFSVPLLFCASGQKRSPAETAHSGHGARGSSGGLGGGAKTQCPSSGLGSFRDEPTPKRQDPRPISFMPRLIKGAFE